MVADLRRDLIIDRSKSKVENMTAAWEGETPLDDASGLEIFFDHARGQVDRLRQAYQVVGRKAQAVGDALICTFIQRSPLIIDLQEAVKLLRPVPIYGLEVLETSGHLAALEELSQRMLQKVLYIMVGLFSGTFAADRIGISTRWS